MERCEILIGCSVIKSLCVSVHYSRCLFLFTILGDREVLDDVSAYFGSDTVEPVAVSPAAEANNGPEERPIIDEMIARMQQEQDERIAAAAGRRAHSSRRRDGQSMFYSSIDLVKSC